MVTVFVILGLTLALFVFSRLRPDLVALMALLALVLTGTLTPAQALAGFADGTTILIAALFVVGEGLARTGVTAWLSQLLLKQADNSELRLLLVLLLGTALLSGFMSNTGTVALLLPAAVAAGWRVGSHPSRLLIPLAFAANIGGMLTLIGTPPNVIVANTLREAGERPFGFFEYGLVGLPILTLFLLFMALPGRRLLPHRTSGRRPTDLLETVDVLTSAYRLSGELFLLRVRLASPLVGQTLAEAALGRDYDISVLSIERGDSGEEGRDIQALNRRFQQLRERLGARGDVPLPDAQTRLQAGDLLVVKGRAEAVAQAAVTYNLGLQALTDQTGLLPLLLNQEVGLAEVLLTPRSELIGRTLAESQIATKFNIQVLSLRRGNQLMPRQHTRLQFGDVLLVRGRWADIERLRQESDHVVVVGAPEALARQVVRLTPRALLAMAVMVGMIVLMMTELVPTTIAALLAAVLMVLGGCLTMEQAYRAMGWQTVVLIAATLPLSTALAETGGAAWIASGLVKSLGALSPLALLAGVFGLTALFSQVMSNTAATVLFAPIVLQAALRLGVSPQPLLMVVAVGASSAFLTPIASATNTLVYEPGGYRFTDYLRMGLPLLLMVFLVTMLLVPLVWPL